MLNQLREKEQLIRKKSEELQRKREKEELKRKTEELQKKREYHQTKKREELQKRKEELINRKLLEKERENKQQEAATKESQPKPPLPESDLLIRPLLQFRSIRLLPQFSEFFRFSSLTFSHKLNFDIPLCRYELQGGICNDDQCQSQHLKGITLTGFLFWLFFSRHLVGFPKESARSTWFLRKFISKFLTST